MNTAEFEGPLFIVGMGRSGTKLLTSLLNNHSQIGIISETNFIPRFIERFGKSPDFSDEATLRAVYDALSKTGLYQTNEQRHNRVLSYAELSGHLREVESSGEVIAWHHLIKYVFKFYLQTPAGAVWGDKSPGYTPHVELLKNLFPSARFIHIVRDPRDVSLSVRNAWGRSVLRSAQGWNKVMHKIERTGVRSNPDYLEIFYEQLVENPEAVLRKVCDFLGVPFTDDLLSLDRSPENLGATKGQTSIVAGNQSKYLTELSAYEIRRISELAYPSLKAYGYPLEGAEAHRKLNPVHENLLMVADGLSTLRFHTKQKGVIQGVRYYLRRYREGRARPKHQTQA